MTELEHLRPRGLIQALPSFYEYVRRVDEADTQAIEDAMRHFAEARNIASGNIRQLARRSWRDKTGGIRYGQPWQALAKPPHRKDVV